MDKLPEWSLIPNLMLWREAKRGKNPDVADGFITAVPSAMSSVLACAGNMRLCELPDPLSKLVAPFTVENAVCLQPQRPQRGKWVVVVLRHVLHTLLERSTVRGRLIHGLGFRVSRVQGRLEP